MSKRIAILGAGAMGSVFGGHLALAGHDVTLVDVRREHMEKVRRDGLVMRSPDGSSQTIHLAATADPARELDQVDLIIVLCKAFATGEAARSITHAVGAGTLVATVQNGLGNDRVLGEVLGVERVVPGTTTVGAEMYEPGVTVMSAITADRRSITHLGPPRTQGAITDGVRELAATLAGAGLPAEGLDSADVVIWTKLAMAGPMGPVTAVLRRSVNDVWNDELGRELIRALFDETIAVGRASGVTLDAESIWEHCLHTFQAVGSHVTSMAADVLARRRTEIDAFCGEITRLGEHHGVPTPVNRTLWRQVRVIEASYDRTLAETAPL